MKMRNATPDDISQLLPLVNSAYRGDAARKGWTHEADLIEGKVRIDAEELRKMMDDGEVVLCFVEDRLRGCVYLKRIADDVYLGMLSVDPEAQGQGIGRRLMQEAERKARAWGASRIIMTVISVRTELLKWYEGFGYRDTGVRSPFPDDGRFGRPRQPLEFVEMALVLPTRIPPKEGS